MRVSSILLGEEVERKDRTSLAYRLKQHKVGNTQE